MKSFLSVYIWRILSWTIWARRTRQIKLLKVHLHFEPDQCIRYAIPMWLCARQIEKPMRAICNTRLWRARTHTHAQSHSISSSIAGPLCCHHKHDLTKIVEDKLVTCCVDIKNTREAQRYNRINFIIITDVCAIGR